MLYLVLGKKGARVNLPPTQTPWPHPYPNPNPPILPGPTPTLTRTRPCLSLCPLELPPVPPRLSRSLGLTRIIRHGPSPQALCKVCYRYALQLLMDRYGRIYFAHVPGRVSTMSFVVFSIVT